MWLPITSESSWWQSARDDRPGRPYSRSLCFSGVPNSSFTQTRRAGPKQSATPSGMASTPQIDKSPFKRDMTPSINPFDQNCADRLECKEEVTDHREQPRDPLPDSQPGHFEGVGHETRARSTRPGKILTSGFVRSRPLVRPGNHSGNRFRHARSAEEQAALAPFS